MRKRLLVAVLVLLALAVFLPDRKAAANCIHNADSELQDINGFRICAGHGGGCDVCFTAGSRSSGSWDLCYYSVASGDWVCTYYL